jgi:hypothetical protein
MNHFHELETEKYYYAAHKNLVKQIRRQHAVRNLFTFLFGIAAIAFGLYAVREMPNWLPATIEFLDIRSIRWS